MVQSCLVLNTCRIFDILSSTPLTLASGYEHVSLRTLPGMAERSIRIGSAGKTFSFTAWKVGWVTGPAPMVQAAAKAHQFLTFTVPAALQRAVARGLREERSFYEGWVGSGGGLGVRVCASHSGWRGRNHKVGYNLQGRISWLQPSLSSHPLTTCIPPPQTS